jgi:hypothetical protein
MPLARDRRVERTSEAHVPVGEPVNNAKDGPTSRSGSVTSVSVVRCTSGKVWLRRFHAGAAGPRRTRRPWAPAMGAGVECGIEPPCTSSYTALQTPGRDSRGDGADAPTWGSHVDDFAWIEQIERVECALERT